MPAFLATVVYVHARVAPLRPAADVGRRAGFDRQEAARPCVTSSQSVQATRSSRRQRLPRLRDATCRSRCACRVSIIFCARSSMDQSPSSTTPPRRLPLNSCGFNTTTRKRPGGTGSPGPAPAPSRAAPQGPPPPPCGSCHRAAPPSVPDRKARPRSRRCAAQSPAGQAWPKQNLCDIHVHRPDAPGGGCAAGTGRAYRSGSATSCRSRRAGAAARERNEAAHHPRLPSISALGWRSR